ncbi:ester cyclase [Algirhabdus cladophorae]|uniref:ester cyclase n=1 Tax=Algirhabdus cladophorae TaxID=3377108 RepID=UPI003B8485C6
MDFTTLKQQAEQILQNLAQGTAADQCYHPQATWHGVHPFNERAGTAAIAEVWQTLRAALPDLERRTTLLVAGENLPDARVSTPRTPHMMACMGSYQGTFVADLLGIPATKGVVHLRFCEAHYLEDGKIMHSTVMLDFLDLMRQAGVCPLAPSLGAEGQWQPPANGRGVKLEATQSEQGHTAMSRVLEMHAALGSFDGKNLDSMPHSQYWTDDFLWYGPTGIGTTRGLSGFRAHHQIPFLQAFPDRAGVGHYIRIGDGDIAVTGGWPSVRATHTGEWLGMAPTGRRIDMRVMDFYRLDGDKIAENWVPIDVIHMALQMGVDLFGRMRHRAGAHPTKL